MNEITLIDYSIVVLLALGLFSTYRSGKERGRDEGWKRGWDEGYKRAELDEWWEFNLKDDEEDE